MNPEDLLIGDDDGEGVVSRVYDFLGFQREAFVCPECSVACEPSHTYNPSTASFDGGACPSWYCDSCSSHYVREVSDEDHGMDLYGRE